MIKKILLNVLVIVLVSALLFSVFKLRYLPDLFLILTVLGGLFFGPYYALVFGFFAGLAYDATSYGFLGFNSLIYMIIGYLTIIPEKKIDIKSILVSCLFIFIFMIIKGILYLGLGMIFLKSGEVFSYFRDIYLFQLALTIVFNIPVFLIYRKINDMLGSFRKNE